MILQVVPSIAKISTQAALCICICFEVPLSCWVKAFWAKTTCFPTRAFTSRSCLEWASFCTSSLHLTQKHLSKCYQICNLIHVFKRVYDTSAMHLLITHQNFLWLLRAKGNIWSCLALPEPQIGAANISSSMKAAFPEFFRIYVYCYSARNDKRMRGEKGIAGQSWKTDIFYSFKIFPNKEHWRRRKEVFWNLYQQRKS